MSGDPKDGSRSWKEGSTQDKSRADSLEPWVQSLPHQEILARLEFTAVEGTVHRSYRLEASPGLQGTLLDFLWNVTTKIKRSRVEVVLTIKFTKENNGMIGYKN